LRPLIRRRQYNDLLLYYGKTIRLSDEQQVTAHIKKLDPALGEIVQAIREIILSTDKEISERIKWNNPSFYYAGEMKRFDPKEYKSDIAVFNLHKGRIMLVFPNGAKIKDQSGLLEETTKMEEDWLSSRM
jgi:hypothetical protein